MLFNRRGVTGTHNEPYAGESCSPLNHFLWPWILNLSFEQNKLTPIEVFFWFDKMSLSTGDEFISLCLLVFSRRFIDMRGNLLGQAGIEALQRKKHSRDSYQHQLHHPTQITDSTHLDFHNPLYIPQLFFCPVCCFFSASHHQKPNMEPTNQQTKQVLKMNLLFKGVKISHLRVSWLFHISFRGRTPSIPCYEYGFYWKPRTISTSTWHGGALATVDDRCATWRCDGRHSAEHPVLFGWIEGWSGGHRKGETRWFHWSHGSSSKLLHPELKEIKQAKMGGKLSMELLWCW